MSTPDRKLLDWMPVPSPSCVNLPGRYVSLEPLDAERHTSALWKAVQAHDELWDWLFDGPYPSEEALRQALQEKQTAKNAVFLAILPRATGEVAGYASFMRAEQAHGVVEVGNILLTAALQRTTAATEAMYLMARHVFDDLGYRRYEWKCNAENLPSRRAAERLGFTLEGVFRQHMVVKGSNRDTAWFSMLESEWPARRKAIETWLDPANFDATGRQGRPLDRFTGPPTAPPTPGG